MDLAPLPRVLRVGRLDAVLDLRAPNSESNSAMKRQPRDQRRRGVEVRLTPRDENLIRAVARFRIADTGSLIRVAFDRIRRDTGIRRLRLLYDSRWLDLRVPGRDIENLYFLGPRGRRWIQSKGGVAVGPPRGSLEHHLGIVRAWAAVASHGIEGLEVVRSYSDWELRAKLGAAGSELVPDLFTTLRVSGQTLQLAVEVDLGTESLRTLTDKIRRYEQHREDPSGLFGARGFGLGLALEGHQREGQIRNLLEAEWGGWSLIWCEPSEFADKLRAALARILAPLTASPCGKGRTATPTLCAPAVEDTTERGL